MSESNDTKADDPVSRNEELVSAIRAALAPDASSEVRATAAHACRAILRGIEPAPSRSTAPNTSAASALAGTPLENALNALSSIPREQVLGFLVTGLRAVLSQNAPTYRPRPTPARETGDPP